VELGSIANALIELRCSDGVDTSEPHFVRRAFI
jgi:hypothetical protein